jgi:hypothetical protein
VTAHYPGFFEQGSSLHAVAIPVISDRRHGVIPFRRAFLSTGVEQCRQVRIPIQGKQAVREKIAIALIVVGVQA